MASKDDAGVSGWHEESRGESIESIEMGLGNDVEVCAGQMVSNESLVVVVVDVERSKTVSGASPGYLVR